MPTRLNIYGQSISTTKKRPCIAATTTNIALSGATTPTIVDGVTISIGDRILVRQQNLSKDNGIYKLETTQLLSRDYDFNISNDLYAGIEVLVLSGLTYSGKTFYLTTTGNITIGSTSLTFDILASQNGASGTSGTSGTSGSNAGITSYTNPADNRVITSVSSTAINAEANLTFDGSILDVNTTAAFKLPVGTTAERPVSPTLGMVRLNTILGGLEIYDGGWSLFYNTRFIDYFIIAGGGGTGINNSTSSVFGLGGGGAGGVLLSGSVLTKNIILTLSIGGGGSFGSNGSNSTLTTSATTFTSFGGGSGGNVSALTTSPGSNGGSGGGGSLRFNSPGGIGVIGQGNNGGNALNSSTAGEQAGGGGGGASGIGGGGAGGNFGGSGGPGVSICSFGIFAGGGGGASTSTNAYRAPGGSGGGGIGLNNSNGDTSGANGSPNTGGGGGGSGGIGGSGLIILRYPSGYNLSIGSGLSFTCLDTPIERYSKYTCIIGGTGNVCFI